MFYSVRKLMQLLIQCCYVYSSC